MSIPEAAEPKPEKKAEAATTTAENSGVRNPFDKQVDIMNPEQNKNFAAAKMLQEVQTATQTTGGRRGYSESEFKEIANNLKGTSTLSLALDNAYANECINAKVCKEDTSSASFGDFRKSLGLPEIKENAEPVKPEVQAEAIDKLSAITGGKAKVEVTTNVEHSEQQTDKFKPRTKEELRQDNKRIRENTASSEKIFSSMNDDLLKKHPEWKISHEGNAIVRRDAQGNEVFRQEGSVTTLTVDGRKYVSDTSKGTKDVIGPDGKLELRRYDDANVVDIPGDKGSILRYYINTNTVTTFDSNGTPISDTIGADGEVVTKLAENRIVAKNGKLDFDNPDKIYQDLLAQGEKEPGIITFENGIAIVKKGDDGKIQVLVVGKNGEVIRSKDNGHFFFGKDGRWVERSLDGSPDRSLTREQWLKLKEECGDDIESLNKFKKTYTLGGDSITLTQDPNNPELVTLQAATTGATTEVGPDGTRTTTTADGVVRTTKPGSSDTTIKGNGIDVKLTQDGLRTPNFDIKRDGNITDLRNNTVISNDSIRTNDGTVYNSKDNTTQFGDGVSIDKYGTVGHTSYDANVAFNRKTESAGQEAKALSAVANAQSMAAEILSKASSGKVTSSDIAALSATLGGLEASIKMLASEVDPSAMLRVMMTKGLVSDSLGQAQSMAGKNNLSGNRTMAA